MRLDSSEADRLHGLLQKTTDRRERARLRGLLQYATPQARAAHGELTRWKMRAPGVKEKILAGMARASAPELVAKEKILAGMARASAPELVAKEKILAGMARASAPELVALRAAWRHAPAEIRRRFLGEVARVIPSDGTDGVP